MNETLRAFGYPRTAVREWDRWVACLRPKQPTLGSLVLIHRSEATRLSDLEPADFLSLGEAITAVEGALSSRLNYEKINYLALMMIDKHVHWHVIPRYSTAQVFADKEFVDAGWPGPPALAAAVELDPPGLERLRAAVAEAFVA